MRGGISEWAATAATEQAQHGSSLRYATPPWRRRGYSWGHEVGSDVVCNGEEPRRTHVRGPPLRADSTPASAPPLTSLRRLRALPSLCPSL
ncbi:unnamed protein product, partial [Urochloa humidicola]